MINMMNDLKATTTINRTVLNNELKEAVKAHYGFSAKRINESSYVITADEVLHYTLTVTDFTADLESADGYSILAAVVNPDQMDFETELAVAVVDAVNAEL